jgi:hypothetical protein
MRKLLFIFLLIGGKSYGQQNITNYLSFAIDNKEVVWVQVYHQEDSIENLSQKIFNHLKRKSWISNVHYDGADIVADVVNYRPDYKRYGGKYSNTSTIIRTGKWSGKVRINVKDQKYRVILYGLNYSATQMATTSGKVSMEQHQISGTLSHWSLNNLRTSLKKSRLSNLDILNASFKDSFTLIADQLIDADW